MALGSYLSGRLSGGHLNPAVTLALASRGDFPAARRVVPYWIDGVSWWVCRGALLVYFDYAEAFLDFERTHGGVQARSARENLAGRPWGVPGSSARSRRLATRLRNVFSEFLGTAVLMLSRCVRWATLGTPGPAGAGWPGGVVGLVVWSIGLSLGSLTGYAINPAATSARHLAASMLGWGTSVFTSHGFYFWIPIAALLAGGLAGGAWLYDMRHRPEPSVDRGGGSSGSQRRMKGRRAKEQKNRRAIERKNRKRANERESYRW